MRNLIMAFVQVAAVVGMLDCKTKRKQEFCESKGGSCSNVMDLTGNWRDDSYVCFDKVLQGVQINCIFCRKKYNC